MAQREYEVWHDENTWNPARPSELVIEDDLSPAEWLAPSLVPESLEVRRVVPQGFDAYAPLSYPFGGEHDEQLTWTEIAQRTGRVAHALMEKQKITLDEYAEWTTFPGFAPQQSDALLAVLARHTLCETACFLLWDGWGDLNDRAFANKPKLRHPTLGFSMYLLSGPLAALDNLRHEPNYWWPDDKAWCLVTDIDDEWAYVSGSAACIEDLVAVPVLDAYVTKAENPAWPGMDTVNNA